MVDRGAFDKIIQAGGYVTWIRTGQPQDANSILIPKQDADEAMDVDATCIGCVLALQHVKMVLQCCL